MRRIADILRSYAVFDDQGRHTNGTDKQSNHSYGDAYEQLLYRSNFVTVNTEMGPLPVNQPYSIRDEIKLMMEVGVADGSCLLAWREVFPNATIVGMDVHPSDKAHGDRIEFHLGDQRSRQDCERAAGGRQFDLIIEDAVHSLENTLLTLYWLWPFVRPGGMYVVEEWDGTDRDRIRALFPMAEVIGTCGPHVADEPLVVFRKPMGGKLC